MFIIHLTDDTRLKEPEVEEWDKNVFAGFRSDDIMVNRRHCNNNVPSLSLLVFLDGPLHELNFDLGSNNSLPGSVMMDRHT